MLDKFILTGLGVASEKLSRKLRYFDRFEGVERKVVKKAPLF
ncbi:hypothetical protein J2S25_003633 [Mesobacillus stamsii]|uniref:Uncharacterized protein n=1 Tax=Mesobacillus stamsii TaxID=225347 RepID=A0ABU0G0T9_9BACI|nr:hypothetical protein [Mesobacillus stamsii]